MNKFDARQTISRDVLARLATAANTELDNLLRSINSELTPPFHLTASSTPNLTVTVADSLVTNAETGKNRIVSPLTIGVPKISGGSGTLVFPASSGNDIVITPGNNYNLNVSSGNYAAVLVYLDSTNNLNVIQGTEAASATLALDNAVAAPGGSVPIGIIVVHNNAGTIQNITNSAIYQFGSGSGGGSATIEASILNNQINPTNLGTLLLNSALNKSFKMDYSSVRYHDIAEADENADVALNLGTGFNGVIYSSRFLSDGSVLVAGNFTTFNGNGRNYLVKLASDGAEDGSFYINLAGAANGAIKALAVQSDGKILVGGNFTSFGGVSKNRLVRLNANGTLDTAFNNNITTGFNGLVENITIQSNGKILIGGGFNAYNGNTRNYLVRLNSDGTEDTSFYTNMGAAFNGIVTSIALVDDGIVIGGGFTSFDGLSAAKLIKLTYNGMKNYSFHANLGTGIGGVGIVCNALAVQSDGKILVGGDFTTYNSNARNYLVRLNPDGTEDTTFYTNLNLNGGLNAAVYSMAVQSDDMVLLGGSFTACGNSLATKIARLNSDGTEDLIFGNYLIGIGVSAGYNGLVYSLTLSQNEKLAVGGNFTAYKGVLTRNFFNIINPHPAEDVQFYVNLGTGFNGDVSDIKRQSDNKILVGGGFSLFNGNTRNRLVRFNSNYTEDTTFYTNLGTAFNNQVYSLDVQSDGKILVGGVFTSFNGNTRNYLVRLNSDGTEDTAFYTNLGTGFNGSVYDVKVQSNGKILISGGFFTFNGNTRNRLVRLNPDGTEDTAFYTNMGTAFGSPVTKLAIQTDDKILAIGGFGTFNGNTRNRLVRLNPDGTEDTAFYTNLGNGFNSDTVDISIQSDGKILVGGVFNQFFTTQVRNRLVRLNPDGTEDTAFYTNMGTAFDGGVYIAYSQPNDKIIVCGVFTNFNGATRGRIVRLNSDGTEDASFSFAFGSGFNNTPLVIETDSSNDLLMGGGFNQINSNQRLRFVKINQESYVSETGSTSFLYKPTTLSWVVAGNTSAGDDTGVEFSVTSAGQVQYTSNFIKGNSLEEKIKYLLTKL